MRTENDYTETDLGNISPNPRGEYDEKASYEYLDLISYQGGSYLCLAEPKTIASGIAPKAGQNTEVWQMIALPGELTPEYIAMYDDTIAKAKQTEASRTAAELAQEAAETARTDVVQMHSETLQAATEARENCDSSAGYAQAAELSRKAAAESEQNINAQVTGFETEVSESVTQATEQIATARQKAVQTITSQQDTSVQAVKDQTAAYISEKNTEAKKEITDHAEQEIVRINAQDSVQQIQKNKEDVALLKEDIVIQRKGVNDGYEYDLLLNYSAGGFNTTNGENVESTTRIRTNTFYKPIFKKTCGILIKNDCQIFIQEFNYKSATNAYEPTLNADFGKWFTEDTTVVFNPSYYYKMMIRTGIDLAIENPLSMAESVVFGKVSQLNYIPQNIEQQMKIDVNNFEIPVEWELGGINGGDGSDVDNAARIRTKKWIDFGNLTEVTIKWNVGQIYIIGKERNTPHVVSTWLSPQEYKLTINKNWIYRIMYQYNGEAYILWADRIHILCNKIIPLNEYPKLNIPQSTRMKVVTMGDSMFLYGNNKDKNSWQYVLNDYFNFKELVSVGIGGSGFVWDTTRNYDMPDNHIVGDNLPLESGVSTTAQHNAAFCSWYRIVNTIPKDADLVILGTGTNDHGANDMTDDLSDMNFIKNSQTDAEWVNSEYYSVFGGDYDITKRRGAILSAIMKIQLQAPNAKIVFINFPNTRLTNGTGKNATSIQNFAYDRAVLDAMEYIHKYWGIPLIDIYGTCGINPLNRAKYTADGIHCNPLGYSTMFANAVIAGLKPLLNNGVDY